MRARDIAPGDVLTQDGALIYTVVEVWPEGDSMVASVRYEVDGGTSIRTFLLMQDVPLTRPEPSAPVTLRARLHDVLLPWADMAMRGEPDAHGMAFDVTGVVREWLIERSNDPATCQSIDVSNALAVLARRVGDEEA